MDFFSKWIVSSRNNYQHAVHRKIVSKKTVLEISYFLI